MSLIAERIRAVQTRIEQAARRSGRQPDEIMLLSVSKLQPASSIREAYAAGLRDFGENYVQELTEKRSLLSELPELRLHLIGHLQRNKVQKVVSAAASVQSIDSVRLALELGQRAALRPQPTSPWHRENWASRISIETLPVLVEVNVGGETQKSGCTPDQLSAVLDAVENQTSLGLVGLMTVVPYTPDPDHARPFFERLVELRAAHGGTKRLPELSMGMTHDLEPAIAAGATIVRIGTAIFGERPEATR